MSESVFDKKSLASIYDEIKRVYLNDSQALDTGFQRRQGLYVYGSASMARVI